MAHRLSGGIAAFALSVSGLSLVSSAPAVAHTTGIHDNCTELNKRWPHGVGKRRARDQTSGTPVTNFKRSTKKYRRAIRHNGTLDRDGDGIACEKA